MDVVTWGDLGEAIGSAAQDAFRIWIRDYCGGRDFEEAYASFLAAIEIHCRLAPGLPVTIVVEIIDRRPGKSSLAQYVVERVGGQQSMWRRKESKN